jgi:hypothetical protein
MRTPRVKKGVRGYHVRYVSRIGHPGERTCWGEQVPTMMASVARQGATDIAWRAPHTKVWHTDVPSTF